MDILHGTALRVFTKNPSKITTLIPRSKQVGARDGVAAVVVHWGFDEVRILANLGFRKVPSPILRHYKWPGPFRPFAHQTDTASFLSTRPRAFCFNEMGTGKTASAIWAADYLRGRGIIKRVLIISPLSIMRSAWEHEIFRLVPHEHAAVAYGTRDKRIEVVNGSASYVVINHDGIKLITKELIGKFDLIIVDEANAFKTATSDRWKALHAMVQPTTWLWMMTGTPASQSPLDAYGLAKLVCPNNVTKYFTAWRDLVMRKMSTFRYLPVHNHKEIVNTALQPAIRYHKRDCLDLPEVMYETRTVEMTAQQQKYYTTMLNKMIVATKTSTITAGNAAIKMQKLLQIACGAAYTDTEDEVMEFDCSSRVQVLKEIIDETDNKVIIGVPYRNAIHMLHKELSKTYTVEVIYGGVSLNERTRIFRAFQEDTNPRVLLIQPQSAAHGVTLTAADTVIWFSPTTSYEHFAQFNARVDRPGQVNTMLVVQIEGCEVERKLNRALRDRKVTSEALLDMFAALS